MKKVSTNFFAQIHPKVSCFYFIILTVMVFSFTSPVFYITTILSGVIYLSMYNEMKKVLKQAAFLIPMVLLVSVVNPLFNHNGNTPLLYVNDKPFTLESLVYGLITGLLLISMFICFKILNVNIDGDKITYIFSKRFPTLALMIGMIFKTIDDLKTQLIKLTSVQSTLGVSTKTGKLKNKLKSGTLILSCLFTIALENSLDTAVSMKSRGYGLKRKTVFNFYKFKRQDAFLLFLIIINSIIVFVLFCFGNFKFEVFPEITSIKFDCYSVITYLFFLLFVNIPFIYNVKEEIKWHFLKSKI